MPLSDLLQVLRADADLEVRDVMVARDAEIARIDAESLHACSERVHDAMSKLALERRAVADAEIAAIERAARTRTLFARAAMLDRLREAVRAELPSLVDEAFRARARASLSGSRDVPTGVVAELSDGTLVEATLEAVLDRAWPQLAAEAVTTVDTEQLS
jgi:hypothetical protein